MQPCAGCGSLGVDPTGHCLQCRAQRRRARSPLLIPLVVLSGILVILVIAIVVTVVRRTGSAARGGSAAPAAPGGSGSAVDRCVVGTWRMNRYTEDVAVNGVAGTVRFTGQGARVRLAAGGTGVTDYGSGTTFTATINGVGYTLVVSGTVSFGYRTGDGGVSFTDVTAAGREVLTRTDTGQQITQDLSGSAEPARYTCAGDVLTQYTGRYRAEMTRLSPGA